MNTIKATIFSFLLLSSLISCLETVTSTTAPCETAACDVYYTEHPKIRFPFRIDTRQPECGFPGFDVTCDLLDRSRLQLPSAEAEVVCSNISRGRDIAVEVAVPAILFVIVLFCCKCCRTKTSTRESTPLPVVAPQQPAIVKGLYLKTLAACPEIVLGDSLRLPKPDDITCSICLSDYLPNETLKTLPECQHCFHANCIDEWLKLNATCPTCRNSPHNLCTGM